MTLAATNDDTSPTVAERQRVERLIAAVMAGMDPQQAVGSGITDRLAIVTAVMLTEASEDVDYSAYGSLAGPDALHHRRYIALSELLDAMSQRNGHDSPS